MSAESSNDGKRGTVLNRRTWAFLALGAAGLCLLAVHLVVTMELWDNLQHNSRVFIQPPADSTAFVSYPLDLWEIANAAKPEGVDLQQISTGGGSGSGAWRPGAGSGALREVTLVISHGDRELLAILPADAATRAAVLARLETEFRERLAAWNPGRDDRRRGPRPKIRRTSRATTGRTGLR